jgi:hypothetical protein
MDAQELLAADAQAPATSAPATPRIASPFTKSAAKAAISNVATRAIEAHPGDRRAARVEVALTQAPGFTCDVDTVAVLGVNADGTPNEVPSALHGFLTPGTPGEPCTGRYGIPTGEVCPGHIRA